MAFSPDQNLERSTLPLGFRNPAPTSNRMRTIKLYATGSATANAVASVTIPNASTIRGIQWAIRCDSITDNAALDVEISRASAREIAILGAQQCISESAIQSNFVTSGLTTFGENHFAPVSVKVVQGQLIYLHVVVTGTLTYVVTALLHYS